MKANNNNNYLQFALDTIDFGAQKVDNVLAMFQHKILAFGECLYIFQFCKQCLDVDSIEIVLGQLPPIEVNLGCGEEIKFVNHRNIESEVAHLCIEQYRCPCWWPSRRVSRAPCRPIREAD